MRQWYVDAWMVYGVDLFRRFTKLLGAGSDTWWTLLRISGNLQDVCWMLEEMEKKLERPLPK